MHEYLSKHIHEEIEGAMDYMTKALEWKAKNTDIAHKFYKMSEMELEHANCLTKMFNSMDKCCCEIKTQNLQIQYENEKAKNVELTNKLDNAQQTQTILGNLGRFVAWAGSGTQAVAAAAGA